MNKYEAIYKKSGNKLPYYKPFKGLLNDHETMAEFLSDPKRIIDTPCFRQYRHPDGTVMGVEDWIREMTLYEFEPLRFVDKDTENGRSSYFRNSLDNCIPAFNEKQAKALYIAHIATNTTDTILAESICNHFRAFLNKPVVKSTWNVSNFNEFIPPYYWKQSGDRFYTEDSNGLALFYLDFFLKYGFERGLTPVGTVPAEIARMGNIYDYRIPFTFFLGIDSQKDEENDDWDEDEDEEEPELMNPIERLMTILEDLKEEDGLNLLERIRKELYYANLDDPDTRREIAYGVLDGLKPIFNGNLTNNYFVKYSLAGKDISEKDLEVLTEAGLIANGSVDIEKRLEENLIEEWETCLDEWVNRH